MLRIRSQYSRGGTTILAIVGVVVCSRVLVNNTPTPRGSLFDDRLFVNANTPAWMKWFLEVYDEKYLLLCNPKQ
ncbi:MAG: hypothetical protein WBZ20_05745 [Nitrososphaeraceae archaeon]